MKRGEKGSVTIIVLVTVFFLVIILTSFFIYTSSRRRAQLEETERIAEAYDGDMDTLYETRAQNERGASVFDTSFGKIDVIWLDTHNNVLEQPMSPILGGMTAVKWNDEEVEESTSSSDATWYEYVAGTGTEDNVNSRWANAKDSDGNYFVWIPRYAYRITYYANENSDVPTGFCDGRGIIDAVGNVIYDLDVGIKTVTYNNMSYIVHPAFMENKTNNFENGGWDTELSGIWVGKYESSRSDATLDSVGTSTNIKIAPNVQSWTSLSIGDMYSLSYEYNRNRESHLMKNSEWGAVAYLTQSQYGRNGNEISINNSSSHITGNSGGSTNAASAKGVTYAYNTSNGILASSTGNIYGIYDLSGGAWEYLASWNAYASTEDLESGSSFASTGGASSKYFTAYRNNTTTNSGRDIYQIGKLGDATKEIYTYQEMKNWFGDYSYFVNTAAPFYRAGGYFEDSNSSGIFASGDFNGSENGDIGFRIVLAIS